MSDNPLLVTIGIPTFNRAGLLPRAIESTLAQSHTDLEVIVCDNSSTDNTGEICRSYVEKDSRIKYFRNATNIGGTSNFAEVLRRASADYFMWLGDDDWIDVKYVAECVGRLEKDPDLALVGGEPVYERGGATVKKGNMFNLVARSPWFRVVSYYAHVSDNGLFYGIMRTKAIRRVRIANVLGGDWLMVSGVAFLGKVEMIRSVSVHRELGGATTSFARICASLGISNVYALFPTLSIGTNAFLDIVTANPVYRTRSAVERVTMASVVFLVIVTRAMWRNIRAIQRIVRRSVVRRRA